METRARAAFNLIVLGERRDDDPYSTPPPSFFLSRWHPPPAPAPETDHPFPPCTASNLKFQIFFTLRFLNKLIDLQIQFKEFKYKWYFFISTSLA